MMKNSKMTHASLFSGIGGAELAASWMGWQNVFHCEINPFGRKVLDYWFPKSKSYEDITKTDFSEWKGEIEVLTGGFPCQPFSQAGKRKGDEDDRYLWPQMLRAIREIQPSWVVGENVAGITSMVESCEDIEVGCTDDIFEENNIYRKEQEFTIERICKDFEREGYSIQPIVIPACAVGAPHRRDRVWFLAHRDDPRTKNEQSREKLSDEFKPIADSNSDGGSEKTESKQKKDRQNNDEHERLCLSNNVAHNKSFRRNTRRPPRKIKTSEKKVGESFRSNVNGLGREQPITDTKSARIKRELLERQAEIQSYGQNSRIVQPDWRNFPTQSPICSRNDGISDRLDGITFPKWRAESIKAYGNAWVPQVAFEIFKAINELN